MEQIVKLAGGKAATNCACVCKSWKRDINDEFIWRFFHNADFGTGNYHTTSGTDIGQFLIVWRFIINYRKQGDEISQLPRELPLLCNYTQKLASRIGHTYPCLVKQP